jgi:hypothetical protein
MPPAHQSLLRKAASRGNAARSILDLFRQAWSGAYRPEGDANEADCLVAFSFGGVRQGDTIRPGASNTALACYAHEHFGHLPMILQGEIADACGTGPSVPGTWRIDRHRRPGRYLDTHEVAAQARQIMEQQGWETAVVLAHGHHMPRAAAVCRKLGLGTVVPPGLEYIPFCPDSFQRWTCSRLLWYRREVGAIVYYRFWKMWI